MLVGGGGGIGKSRFARFISDDTRIENHYDFILWVYVREDELNTPRIAKSLIDQAIGKDCCISEDESDLLGLRIYQELSGKRYLIVLDDVLRASKEQWEQLKLWLEQSAATGSSLIITTHNKRVARMMTVHNLYDLLTLEDDDAWGLFCRRSLINEDKESCSEVLEISIKIIGICGDLPLLVNLMGGLMRFEKEPEEWQRVICQMNYYCSKYGEHKILQACIKICYDHLASEIKQHLMFRSFFPSGYYMDKQALIKLWMASGLFPSDESMSLEEKGNRIFNELALRNFFEDVKLVPGSSSRDKHGHHSRLICKMHDLTHDLAKHVSQNEHLALPDSYPISSLKVHSSISGDSLIDIPK